MFTDSLLILVSILGHEFPRRVPARAPARDGEEDHDEHQIPLLADAAAAARYPPPHADSPHDAKKLYELRGGECLINETIDSECDVPYNPARMRFEDKKIAINVFMVSVSGKVSAGTATFSLLGKEANTAFEQLQFLEKCPDKQAKIAYSFLFEPLRSRPDRPDRLDRTIIHERRTEEFEDQRKKTSYNSMQLPQTSRSFQQNDAISRLASRSPVQPRNSVNESQVEEVYSIGKREQSKNQGNGDTSLAVHEFLRERKEGRTRQKSKSIKKIVEVNSSKSLHHQMSFVPSPIRINTEYVTEQDTEEMEKLKGKIKNLERNDRTNVQTLRETKEEAERKRNRINQLELAKSELEETVRIRDEKIRRLEKSMKDLQEQAEETNNQLKSSRTQSELRENITREQVKKSEDKYRQSEAEREKITEEYNRALKTYEETEKKYQNILKEKERTHHEEKGKINKKAEALALNLEDAQKEIRELKNQIDDFSRERRQLLESSNEFAIELENCKQICESLTSKLKAESDHTKQL